MNLTDLKPAKGARKESYRKGRGNGSGNGKTAGRGMNGQKSRSGGNIRIGFEGGQMPFYRRLPQRGIGTKAFHNWKDVLGINVDRLNVFDDGTVVTVESLQKAGIIDHPKDGVKILGKGELKKKLTVKVGSYSKAAKEKIEAAGGTAE